MDGARPSWNAPSADDCTQAPSPPSDALIRAQDAEAEEWIRSELRGCRAMFLWLFVGLALWAGIIWGIIALVDRLRG